MMSSKTSTFAFRAPVLLGLSFLVVACQDAGGESLDSISTGDSASPYDTDQVPDTSSTANTSDSVDTSSAIGSSDTGFGPSPWAGGHSGDLTMVDVSRNRELCTGPIDIDVSADGLLSGNGTCAFGSGAGGGLVIGVELAGEVYGDGSGTGTATTDLRELRIGAPESVYQGGFTGSDLTFDWSLEIYVADRPVLVACAARVR
jgi:hypothetical protein